MDRRSQWKQRLDDDGYGPRGPFARHLEESGSFLAQSEISPSRRIDRPVGPEFQGESVKRRQIVEFHRYPEGPLLLACHLMQKASNCLLMPAHEICQALEVAIQRSK